VRRVVVAVAAAALAGAPAAQAEKRTIAVTSVSVAAKRTDVPPKGTSRGDTILLRDRLFNARRQFGKARGVAVGSDHGTMTFTGAHTARFSGVAVLPGGTLRLNGKVVPVTNGLVIPVTGGTGRFARAKGFVVVGHGDRTAPNTYVLMLPTIPVA
jgi:dirigent-like protein